MAKNEIKKYRFRMPTYLAWFCLFAGATLLAMGIDIVSSEPRSMTLIHFVRLSPGVSYYLSWALLVFFVWCSMVGVLQFFSTHKRERFIVLGKESITFPVAPTFAKDLVVPYGEILRIKQGWTLNLLSPQKWVRLIIQYEGGRAVIFSPYLGDYPTYQQFYETLVARSTRARA